MLLVGNERGVRVEVLKKLLDKHNRTIATHRGAEYSYLSRPEDIKSSMSYEVNIYELTLVQINYFIDRLENENYTHH